jgi:endoribonuclease Dicer
MEIEDSDKQDDFRPRPYQEQLLNLVKEQNTILYLPTGSGKTFIAVMLIKEMSGSLKKLVFILSQLISSFLLSLCFTVPFWDTSFMCFHVCCYRNKHTFFMVNTVALVNQQAAYIKRHSHHSVGEYSGDMNVDFWSKDKWQTELQDHQVKCPDQVVSQGELSDL